MTCNKPLPVPGTDAPSVPPATAVAPLRIWTLSKETPGMLAQADGLARAVGGTIEHKSISQGRWWWGLSPAWHVPRRPEAYGCGLEPPWPDLLIAVGRRTLPAALAVGRASGRACRTVYIQHPGRAAPLFDAVVAGTHDQVPGANVIHVLGSVGSVRCEDLAARRAAGDPWPELPRPRLGVLLGGANSAYAARPAQWRRLGATLAAALEQLGGSALITPSRRTGERCCRAFLEPWRKLPYRCWTPPAPNPYLDYLAHSDLLAVTCDSVNMLSEACTSGRPVFILPLQRRSLAPWRARKFRRFAEELERGGYARPFRGVLQRWQPPALDETRRAASELRRHLFPARPADPRSNKERDRQSGPGAGV